MIYRKKPDTVEAFQYNGEFANPDEYKNIPKWILESWSLCRVEGEPFVESHGAVLLSTPKGYCYANAGDYIIRSRNYHGGLEICDAETFEETYGKVDERKEGENG